jgi:hypothetical protein
MKMNSTEKKLTSVISTMRPALGDSAKGVLQGMLYTKYTKEKHGFETSLCAVNGHILFQYFLNDMETAIFEKYIKPKYFNNGCDVLFTEKKTADDNKDSSFPNVNKVIPTKPIDPNMPVRFAAVNQYNAVKFISAASGEKIDSFLPNVSTNMKSRDNYGNGACAVIKSNYIALVMPVQFLIDNDEIKRTINFDLLPIEKIEPMPEPIPEPDIEPEPIPEPIPEPVSVPEPMPEPGIEPESVQENNLAACYE